MIEIKNLHKAFGQNQVLKGVDITVNKGDVVVVIGPSGSGKTTMLRCINFLEKADEGTITVGALASLVFGVKTAEEICADGDAVMSERMKEELGKIIPLSRVYLNETV